MKTFLFRIRTGVVAIGVFFAPLSASAVDAGVMAEITKAQIILGQVQQVMDTLNTLTVDLKAPKPRPDNKGKFLVPYTAEGEPTEWSQKIMQSQAGKMVGEKAGGMAANALASKVPFGGLAGGMLKKKAKESAAVMAMGGMKKIKKQSELSFNNLNDYAVYLQARHGSDPDFKIALASAIALYPDLEHRFTPAVKMAYRKQAKQKKK